MKVTDGEYMNIKTGHIISIKYVGAPVWMYLVDTKTRSWYSDYRNLCIDFLENGYTKLGGK